jgi:hypothetical protein
MSDSPAAILYDSGGTEKGTSGNPVKTDPTGTTAQPVTDNGGSLTVDGSVAISNLPAVQPVNDNGGSLTVDGTVTANQGGTWNVNNVSGTVSLPTGAATETTLASIKSTDGIKKITDPLPAGTNTIGSVKLVGSHGNALDIQTETAVPADPHGFLVVGFDGEGYVQPLDVREDPQDGSNRLQIEGKVSIVAPAAPPNTTPVSIDNSTPLPITGTTDVYYAITNNKTFTVMQLIGGAEGDPTEKGTVVEIFYDDIGTLRIIDRLYLSGQTVSVYPNTSQARDGTALTGNAGGTKRILLRRRRLSNSAQEVDAVVRGYEQ